MIREVRLNPKATVSGWSNYVDPNTSPYPWLGTGSMTVDAIWRQNGEASTPPPGSAAVGSAYAYCWPQGGTEHAVSFEPGPTLVTFNKVTFKTRFDYSQTGPNNWYGNSGNGFMVGLKIMLRNRAKDGWHYGTACYIGDPNSPAGDLSADPGDKYNVRPAEGAIFDLTPWLSWELTSHPEGGPFTLEDINNLAAGVSFLWWGPNDDAQGSPAFDNSQGSFFKIRVPNFVCILTVQDLGGYVRAVRHNASATLRMERKARNTITMKVPAFDATKEIGETVNFASDQGGAVGEGWGDKALERGSGWLAQRTYWPEALRVDDECYDLHDFSCEMWGSFRIPIAWTPELSGIAYLDRGGEFTMSRAQDGWSMRPGDGVAVRVIEDYLNVSEDGLAIHSNLGTEMLKSNAELGSGDWTSTTSGGASFAAETGQPMADELGYTDAIRLTFGGTDGSASKSQAIALTTGDTLSLRARVRNISNDDPETKFLEVALISPTTQYWDEANRTWSGSPVYNEIPGDGGFGEAVFDQVPISETGNFTIKIGRMSTAINTATFIVALASAQKNAHGCGMPLVTLASTIARTPDVVTFNNASPFTFWHRDRGCLTYEFRPFWRAASLTAATEKPLITATHATGSDEVRFVAGATDTFVFERVDGGFGTKTVSIDILDANDNAYHLTRGNYVRVFARWLDSNGWRDRPPFEALIAYAIYTLDGTFVSYHEETAVWEAPDSAVEDEVALAGLDGWLRWIEVKHNPVSPIEAVWRR